MIPIFVILVFSDLAEFHVHDVERQQCFGCQDVAGRKDFSVHNLTVMFSFTSNVIEGYKLIKLCLILVIYTGCDDRTLQEERVA